MSNLQKTAWMFEAVDRKHEGRFIKSVIDSAFELYMNDMAEFEFPTELEIRSNIDPFFIAAALYSPGTLEPNDEDVHMVLEEYFENENPYFIRQVEQELISDVEEVMQHFRMPYISQWMNPFDQTTVYRSLNSTPITEVW